MRLVLALLVLLSALPAAAQAPNPSFTLSNRAGLAIHEIYATPAGVDRWGRDRLGANLVPPGGAFPVRLPADGSCLYDIRVVYADGRPEERRRINTCEIETMAFPGGRTTANEAGPGRMQGQADDPSFRLVNRGRAEVNEVYVSETGNDRWGEDRLGDDTVPRGATRVIRMQPGACTYDVRVVFANGEATEKRRLNLCGITDLRVP
jgi:hypothetical protein